jgi:PIN domain nuclease of toxin-antitoxin system
MKYLLDTHTSIWWSGQSGKLSPKVTALFQSSSDVFVLSLASIWEMQIKIQLGKLTFPTPLNVVINRQQQINGLELLPISVNHILTLDNLPMHHRDPFDRMLIAQAQVENMPLISHDPVIAQYPITVIWQ